MSGREGPDPLTLRARELFERSVEGLDAATRSRLTRSRHEALAAAAPRRPAALRSLVPAGALVAVLGIAVWLGQVRVPLAPEARVTSQPNALEFVAQAEEIDLLDEDIEFYAWAVDSAAGQTG